MEFTCPKCNGTNVRQQVSVFVDAPAGCRNLSKSGIRRKDVIILGVGWNRASMYCECGWLYPVITDSETKD